MNDPQVETVLRLVGDIDDKDSHLLINGQDIGRISELLISKSNPMYSIPHAYNYILKLPKGLLAGSRIITVKIVSQQSYKLGYSSGIAPLPQVAHAKLIHPSGELKDISAEYYHRRFRFSMVMYFISKEYSTLNNDPLILGSIHLIGGK